MAVDQERHARIVGSLADSPFDAVICGSATEVLLLTGYWPVMSASVAVFTSDGEVKVIVPEDEVELAEKTTGAEIIPYETAGLHALHPAIQSLRTPLISVLQQLGASHAKIGLQLEQGVRPASYAVSTQFRSSLLKLLSELHPRAEYIACDEFLEALKAVKTAKELELMQKAAVVAAAGFAPANGLIRPGLRESEVSAALQAAFERTQLAETVQRTSGYFFCMSGPNSAKAAAAYARTRQRVLEEGDLVMIHANTCADGYWTDITRTFTVGRPSDRQMTMREAVDEARRAALRAIYPGVKAREVDHAARSVMRSHGFGEAFKHATGHGVGFAAANPNGLPRIHPLSPDVLEAGMTFNIEPAAYFDGYGGMRHCDLVAVNADGVDTLTKF
ncbi:Xaa-Pro aminopeptidase [Tunturiibacter psychrotolerans]